MSFGCERSCSSPQAHHRIRCVRPGDPGIHNQSINRGVSNFNSNVPQGGIQPHINFERDLLNMFRVRVLTSSGSTGGRGDAKTIISPNTLFGDIIRPEAPGVRSKHLIPTLPLLGLWTRVSGGVKYPGQVAPTTRSLFWFPADPRRRCSKFFNLNLWKGYCYNKILLIVPRVGTGTHPFQSTPQPLTYRSLHFYRLF